MCICLCTDKESPEGEHGRIALLLVGRELGAGWQGKDGDLSRQAFLSHLNEMDAYVWLQ